MKKHSVKSMISLILIGLVLSCAFSISATIGLFVESLVWNKEEAFAYHVGDLNLSCYPIEGDEDNGIAIAWGGERSTTPDNLTIPSTIAVEETTYTIKCLAKSAFRYCDFSAITLPDTIEEIQAESFYSCQKLEEFTLPPQLIHGIAPSTFMDCRELRHVDTSRVRATIDAMAESSRPAFVIGDHAFNSCIRLEGFDCPSSLREIGDSAFQKCVTMVSFFFPDANNNDVNPTNTISVGNFAFADCIGLKIVYFQTNVTHIGEFAFALGNQAGELKIYYTGDPDAAEINTFLGENWRKKHAATDKTNSQLDYVAFFPKYGQLKTVAQYPGLVFSVVKGQDILFDGTTDSTRVPIDSTKVNYIEIFRFETPNADKEDYFEDGVLTIPNTISVDGVDVPVKTIAPLAFKDNSGLLGVVFNESLVQICKNAFEGCNNIATLNFDACKKLKEISYNVFRADSDNTTENDEVERLVLPSCLTCIGARAFYKFTNVHEFALPDETLFIGEEAFSDLGSKATDYYGTVDITLPETLRDACAGTTVVGSLVPHRIWKPTGQEGNAIQRRAFYNAKILRSVTMEKISDAIFADADKKHNDHNHMKQYRIGIGPEAFAECTYLLSFKANQFQYFLTNSCFAGCPNLKELFLDTYGSETTTWTTNPWGVANSGNSWGGSIFGTTVMNDLVIYVKGNKRMDKDWNHNPAKYMTKWNSDGFGLNPFGPSAGYGTERTIVPTYYNVDWYNNAVQYLKLADGTISTTPDYDGCVAFLPVGGKRTVSKCYTAATKAEIDLSVSGLNSLVVDTIGSCAFITQNNGVKPSTKFVLPNTIAKIDERAFYGIGVSQIKYKDSAVQGADNACTLPSTITSIENLAFYGNTFNSVTLSGSLAYLGMAVFKGGVSTPTKPTFAATGNFVTEQDGKDLYAVNGGNYALLYDINNGETSPTFKTNTVAIGPYAMFKSTYTSVALPNTLTTIYGGAFKNSTAITEVTCADNLVYISPQTNDGTWNSFGVMDDASSDRARTTERSLRSSQGAFQGCSALTTFDLSGRTALKKIGYNAFKGCSALADFGCGSKKYKFYKYDKTTNQLTDFKTYETGTGILDLSASTNLESIGKAAFEDCSKLEVVILPNSSNFYAGRENHTNQDPGCIFPKDHVPRKFDKKFPVLIGETALYAHWNANSGTPGARDRYPQNIFSNNEQCPYYHLGSSADISRAVASGIWYWVKLSRTSDYEEYVLLNNADQADDFFEDSDLSIVP